VTVEFELDCSISRDIEAHGEDAACPTQPHGQGSPVGSSQSACQHAPSAMMAIAVRSADPDAHCPETAGGRLIFHTFGALAEFDRSVIRERIVAGPDAARARGRKGG
jgi:hypothetical protein